MRFDRAADPAAHGVKKRRITLQPQAFSLSISPPIAARVDFSKPLRLKVSNGLILLIRLEPGSCLFLYAARPVVRNPSSLRWRWTAPAMSRCAMRVLLNCNVLGAATLSVLFWRNRLRRNSRWASTHNTAAQCCAGSQVPTEAFLAQRPLVWTADLPHRETTDNYRFDKR